MRSPCELCGCLTESGEDCPQCGGEVVTLDDAHIPDLSGTFAHGGLLYLVDEVGWCRVYDPQNEGVWMDKGPASELVPAGATLVASNPLA